MMEAYLGHIGCRGPCIVMEAHLGHIGCRGSCRVIYGI